MATRLPGSLGRAQQGRTPGPYTPLNFDTSSFGQPAETSVAPGIMDKLPTVTAKSPSVISSRTVRDKMSEIQKTVTPIIDPNKTKTENKSVTPTKTTQTPTAPVAPVDPLQAQIDEYERQADADIQQLNTLKESIDAEGDEALKAQLEQIQQMFDQRRIEQRQINSNVLQTQQQAGLRSGRARYASEIQSSMLADVETKGVQRIAALDMQQKQLEVETRDAARDKAGKMWATALQNFSMIQNIKRDKQQAINELRKNAMEQQSLIQEQAKAQRDEMRFEREEKEYARKVMLEDSGMIAGNLIGMDEEGNIQMPDMNMIQQIAIDMGVDPNYLMSSVRTKAQELSKLSSEEMKRELDIMKIQKELKEEKMGTDRSDFERMLRNGELPEGTGYFDYLEMKKEATTSPEDTSGLSKDETALRKEFNLRPIVKELGSLKRSFVSMDSAYKEALKKGANEESKAAADQALVTLFNKMLDPLSVVRESEYARSFLGQSAMARAEGYVERLVQGGAGLTDANRKDMVDMAKKFFDNTQQMYDEEVAFYKDIAQSSGLDPDRVIKPLGASNQDSSDPQATPEDAFLQFTDSLTPENRQAVNDMIASPILKDADEEDIYEYFREHASDYGGDFNPVGSDTDQAAKDWRAAKGSGGILLDQPPKTQNLISKAFNSLIPGAHAAEPVITERDVQIYESRNGSPSSSPTTILDGLKVITKNVAPELQKFADNCVFFARQIVPNIPTGALNVAGRKEGIKAAERGGYGGFDLGRAQVGDALHTTEGNVGHTAVIVGEKGNNWILKEANYKSGQVTEGRQIAKNDPKLLGWIRPKGSKAIKNQKNEGRNQGIEEEVQKIARKSPVFKSYYFSS